MKILFSLLTISTSVILFISAAGVLQALILAAVLYFHPKSDRSVNRFLSLHILTVSIFMLMPVAEYIFSWHILTPLVCFQFLIGPFLYLYILSFKGTIRWRTAWPHFILFLIVTCTVIFYYFPWTRKFPASEKPPAEILLAPVTYALVFARNLQMVIYYFLCRRVLSRYQRSIQHLYSETSRIDLSWVRWLLNGFLLLIITVFIIVYFVVTYPENFSLFILINTAIITPYIYAVAIKGVGQLTLWQVQPDKDKEAIEEEINEVERVASGREEDKQELSALPGAAAVKHDGIISRINTLMEKEKLYQEPELTLQLLSEKLQTPSYLTSQAINEGLKKSFYDLVNGYRIEEAKRLLVDPRNSGFTILSIGFDAGFNSKTTFHTVFKKFTGLTPTEYQKKYRTPSAEMVS